MKETPDFKQLKSLGNFQDFVKLLRESICANVSSNSSEKSFFDIIYVFVCSTYCQGRNEGGRGAQFLGRRITMGAPNDCRGRRKVPTMSQVLFSIQLLPKDL